MNKEKSVKIVLMFFLFFLLLGVAYAACNIVDNTYINIDTTLQPNENPCYVNDSGASGILIINANNITLDCNGTHLMGDDSGYAIYHDGFNNTTVKNCVIEDYETGIYHRKSNWTVFQNISINSSLTYGVYVLNSYNNTFKDLNLSNNGWEGLYVKQSYYNTFANSTSSNNNRDGGIYFYFADNNVLYNLTSLYDPYGIALVGSSNNNVTSCVVNNTANAGLYLQSTYTIGNRLVNNSVSNANIGIRIDEAATSTLINNTITNSTQYSFYFAAAADSQYTQYIDQSNTIDEKPIWFNSSVTNEIISSNWGFVSCYNCTNITVQDMNLSHNSHAVLFRLVKNSTIKNITTNYPFFGFFLSGVNYTTIINNTITIAAQRGMHVITSYNNSFINNTVIGNEPIHIYTPGGNNSIINSTFTIGLEAVVIATNYNEVLNNIFYNKTTALRFNSGNYSIIKNNNFTNNSYGIYFNGGVNATISGNIIQNSTRALWFDSGAGDHIIVNNTVCYSGTFFYNTTTSGDNTVDNNTFCVDPLFPANNEQVQPNYFSFNASNIATTPTSCTVYLDGTSIASNSSILDETTTAISYSVTGVGTHYWYVYCNDSATTNWGNSSQYSFIVPEPGGGGGGGGGDLPTVKIDVLEEEEEIFEIEPGETVIIIPSYALPISEITVSVKAPVSDIVVSFTGEADQRTCKSLGVEKGSKIGNRIIYECFDISQNNLPDELIDQINITFNVGKFWIRDNNINMYGIEMMKYKTEVWQSLDTFTVSELSIIERVLYFLDLDWLIRPEGEYQYRATTSSLSPFVIVGEKRITFPWWVIILMIVMTYTFYKQWEKRKKK
jgi:PGF-pre-PGF domain-containing protein